MVVVVGIGTFAVLLLSNVSSTFHDLKDNTDSGSGVLSRLKDLSLPEGGLNSSRVSQTNPVG